MSGGISLPSLEQPGSMRRPSAAEGAPGSEGLSVVGGTDGREGGLAVCALN